jgi:hypothetical protein
MNKRWWFPGLFFLMLLSFIIGCRTEIKNGQNNKELTPTSISSPTNISLSPTMTLTNVIGTTQPTLIAWSKEDLITSNGNCTLPCFWSISPGETKWADAITLFEQIGAKGAIGVSPRNIETFVTQIDFEQVSILLKAYRKDDVVGAMTVTISHHSPLDALPTEINQYSLRNSFSNLGTPSKLLLQLVVPPEESSQPTSYSFWVYYDSYGLQESYLGDTSKMNASHICPEHPFEQLILYLYSPELKFLPWDTNILTDHENIKTVGDISKENLYQSVTKSSEPACIKIDQ